ncbi:hypothetical protein CHELA1G11_12655 [Hyphomicrobiales bacterium]|nr:hypothetical protein CHELA1G2_11652 [Hyphomicrobiales bacterium]CAH1666200.1 hypothetical protein CHELA1G11_12655 [Hyphomicrobiales bacterium]
MNNIYSIQIHKAQYMGNYESNIVISIYNYAEPTSFSPIKQPKCRNGPNFHPWSRRFTYRLKYKFAKNDRKAVNHLSIYKNSDTNAPPLKIKLR